MTDKKSIFTERKFKDAEDSPGSRPAVKSEIEPIQEIIETKTLTEQEQEQKEASAPVSTTPSSKNASDVVIEQAGIELKLIEDMLAEGLDDVYRSLPLEKKMVFKKKGEDTARKIQTMVVSLKVHASNIIDWIVEWLKVVPGLNQFFLKQEAKIKTDKILNYFKDKQKV